MSANELINQNTEALEWWEGKDFEYKFILCNKQFGDGVHPHNVTIGTKAVWTIGGDLKWQYSKIIIKHIKKNSNEQKQQ